jgi:hypothetical protein
MFSVSIERLMVSIARGGLPQTGDVIYVQLLGANTVAAREKEC